MIEDQGPAPSETQHHKFEEPPTNFAAGTSAWFYFRGRTKQLHALQVETGTAGLEYHAAVEKLFYLAETTSREEYGPEFRPPILMVLCNPNPASNKPETPKVRA